jgi:hypothetical protein
LLLFLFVHEEKKGGRKGGHRRGEERRRKRKEELTDSFKYSNRSRSGHYQTILLILSFKMFAL